MLFRNNFVNVDVIRPDKMVLEEFAREDRRDDRRIVVET